MITSLAQKLLTNTLVFRLLLRLFPTLLLLNRTREDFARRVYNAYTMLPPGLTAQGARAAHHTARVLSKRPLEAALHRAVAYRFDFDNGTHLEEWASRVDELLARCDEHLESDAAADLLLETLWVLFHPNVHQGSSPSPFIDQPKLTERLLSHPCLARLRSPLATVARPLDRNNSRPIRALVLTDMNFNFMGSILEHWGQDPNVDLRARNLQLEDVDRDWWSIRNTMLDRLQGTSPAPPEFLREDLEWADVVYVEWNEALAARLSGIALDARLVVRLHRYEAFTQTPTLTNWDNVDDVIIITPYMRELLERTLPGIEDRTSIRFCPNVVDLQQFRRVKLPTATRSMAIIQWASIVKDPAWALEVLRLLHKHDPTWRLLLIGSDTRPAHLDKNLKEYLDEFDRAAAAFGDSVQRLGHRDDLAEAMREVGVILSCSRVEGAPVSLQEAVASGALPVVRDWPIVKAIEGARSLYPENWVVETPPEAVERILSWAQSNPSFDEEQCPQSWMIRHYDAPITLSKIDRVLYSA